MNPEPAVVEIPTNIPTTSGMTTKVVKGSLWMLIGRVLPLAFSLVTMPFVIRLLGAEKYGVLILVGLVPAYFGFADFGMGVASTKFGADAFSEGDPRKEAEVVQTAVVIALASSLIVAVPIFIFSGTIARELNVPEYLLYQANIAFKITSVAFIAGILSSVVNSPQLARMRMDLTTAVSVGFTVLMLVTTPFVLLFGGGIVGAVWTALMASVLIFIGHSLFAWKLLPELSKPIIRREMFRPMLTFGGAWLMAMVAGGLLVNIEKIFLTRLVSVEALAYYSVAFTFSTVATLFSSSMLQTLIPAFARLRSSNQNEQFAVLLARGLRITVLCMLPTIVSLFVLAKPFFTVWAGEDFGRESTLPLYILLIGLQFSVVASVPFAAISAVGRTNLVAKVLWLELIPFIGLVFFSITWFGIVGAAIAWSLRAVIEAVILIHLAKRVTHASFGDSHQYFNVIVSILILSPVVLFTLLFQQHWLASILSLPVFVVLYAIFVWKSLVEPEERRWIEGRVSRIRNRRRNHIA